MVWYKVLWSPELLGYALNLQKSWNKYLASHYWFTGNPYMLVPVVLYIFVCFSETHILSFSADKFINGILHPLGITWKPINVTVKKPLIFQRLTSNPICRNGYIYESKFRLFCMSDDENIWGQNNFYTLQVKNYNLCLLRKLWFSVLILYDIDAVLHVNFSH